MKVVCAVEAQKSYAHPSVLPQYGSYSHTTGPSLLSSTYTDHVFIGQGHFGPELLYSTAQSLVAKEFVFSTATPRHVYLSQTAEVLQRQLGGIFDAGDAEVDNTMSFARNLGECPGSIVHSEGEEDTLDPHGYHTKRFMSSQS